EPPPVHMAVPVSPAPLVHPVPVEFAPEPAPEPVPRREVRSHRNGGDKAGRDREDDHSTTQELRRLLGFFDEIRRARAWHEVDGAKLVAIRQQLAGTPSQQLTAAFTALKKSADAALTAGPWSVMDKKTTVSPDKHDYYSLATYFFPNPSTPDHCPYVHEDGKWGPDVATTGDMTARARAWQAISDLTLAWFYTGDAKYASRAELDIRTWFLNSATKMNPNMTFGQVVPCTTVGRKEGIIESAEAITQVVDALAILDSGAPGWSSTD